MYRRGFDTHHVFSVDEFYWEDRPRYYEALNAVRREGGDLKCWIEYAAEGLHLTLDRVWTRVQRLSAQSGRKKLVLRPKQEQLLQLLRDHKRMTPGEIWDALGISKQGALDLLRPLIKAGLVKRMRLTVHVWFLPLDYEIMAGWLHQKLDQDDGGGLISSGNDCSNR